tara:strand:- start:2297 stop:2713 length:417 start_codon:yes stop_codon:yes gene_type:complete
LAQASDPYDNYTDWAINSGDKKGNQYSELAYIHAANLQHLKPAWEYKVNDATDASNMHSNPIIIDGLMYFTTSSLQAVAINAGTGKEVWKFISEDHHPEKRCFGGATEVSFFGNLKIEKTAAIWARASSHRVFYTAKR